MPDIDREIHRAEQALREAKDVERWLNLSYVCRRLSITRHTAYRWIAAGRFRRTRQTLTGRWQVSASALACVEAETEQRMYENGANGANGASQ